MAVNKITLVYYDYLFIIIDKIIFPDELLNKY